MDQPIKIVLINGPPRSGKDTLGQMLRDLLPKSRIVKFAEPLKGATVDLYAALSVLLPADYEDCWEGPQKEQPSELFLGLSPRQAAIAVSETLLKPLHGADVFGRLAAEGIVFEHLHARTRTFIVTDSGFVEEARVLVERFGADNVVLLRMHRDGCTFEGDSRSHISLPGCETRDICNNGSLARLRHCAQVIAGEFGL